MFVKKIELETFVYHKSNKKNKPKVLLIHGFATDHRCFTHFIESNKEFEIHAINLLGMGLRNSKLLPQDLNIKKSVKLITKYIKDNELKELYLIGHSLGAAVSAMVAKQVGPDYFNKIFLLAPYNITSLKKIIDKPKYFNFKNKKLFLRFQEIIFKDYSRIKDFIGEEEYYKETQEFYKRNNFNLFYIGINMVDGRFLKSMHSSYKNLSNFENVYLWLGEYDNFVDNHKTVKYLSKYIKCNIYTFRNCGHAFFVEDEILFSKKIREEIFGK